MFHHHEVVQVVGRDDVQNFLLVFNRRFRGGFGGARAWRWIRNRQQLSANRTLYQLAGKLFADRVTFTARAGNGDGHLKYPGNHFDKRVEFFPF
jgi:hypothetical protein